VYGAERAVKQTRIYQSGSLERKEFKPGLVSDD
jgi:hypothetical protein